MANTAASKKQKGSRLEHKIAAAYRETGLFPKARRQLLSGGGYLKGDINKGEPDIWVEECKNQERVSLWAWWQQAEEQCGPEEKPVLHVSGNYRPVLTIMSFQDFLQMRLELQALRQQCADLTESTNNGIMQQ